MSNGQDPTIRLYIYHDSSAFPFPPQVVNTRTHNLTTGKDEPDVPGDMVPWRMAQVKRGDLPAGSPRRVGHRPKRKGYFYRFLGGNTKFGLDDEEVQDGDFGFEANRGRRTVRIVMESADWEFHSISLSGPIVQTNTLPDSEVLLNFDTNTDDDSKTSGQIGMVVVLPEAATANTTGSDVYLYVDPDWDNRH